jgi:uncharacterized protein GlcG (DUF336 family)
MRLQLTTAAMLLLAATAPRASLAQALPQSPRLTLEAGRRIATAAQARARAMNLRVVVAVLDEGGHAILLERMDGTQTASVEIALAKARSAAAFKRPTREMASWVAGGEVALMALPGMLPVEGGIPIVAAGHVVGSIGVSGASAEQDGEVARAGVAALEPSTPGSPPRGR